MGRLLICPVRRIGQNPDKMLAPYVTSGMTVLEVGPGMGFFTLPMARMVGRNGKVVCVDVQPRMIAALRNRAAGAGLADRLDARVCETTSLGIDDLAGQVDFVLLFAVVHEIPDTTRLMGEIVTAMKPGARCLIAEPKFHVLTADFDQTIAAVARKGLQLLDRPRIWGSHTAVLKRI
jgi:ubiquinone/menaquinone biosynthesis C-methylase UbiE